MTEDVHLDPPRRLFEDANDSDPVEAEKGRAMPAIGRFLTAIGVDPAKATDDPPTITFGAEEVWVKYTGLIRVPYADFARAGHQYTEWTPAPDRGPNV